MAKNTAQIISYSTGNEVITDNSSIINNDPFGDRRLSNLEITGIGNIQIRNTGGSSASEGGMGSGGGTDKGPGTTDPKKEKQENNSKPEDADDDTWDPLKPKEEKAKGKD